MTNLFENLPTDLTSELTKVLVRSENVRVETILSYGQKSPEDYWYDQNENEWVVVLQGSGEVTFDDGTVKRLFCGDHLIINAHQRHRVSWTDPNELTVWLAVFYK